MGAVVWLHLSDWHQKTSDDFDRSIVLQALLRDIENRASINRRLERVDFAVFSGDVAHGGKAAEYRVAKDRFLDPVLQKSGVDPKRLFIVPGNHDLDRSRFDLLPGDLTSPIDEAKTQKWLGDDEKLDSALKPFKDYRAFAAAYMDQERPDHAAIARFDVEGVTVGLLGLNSAWMSARNVVVKDGKEEIVDYGHLVVGEPQVRSGLEYVADAQLRIAVAHHPISWLTEFDRGRTNDALKPAAHLLLTGHQHDQRVTVECGTDGSCILVSAGAAYERRDHANGYNFVWIDTGTGKGTVYFRRWNGKAWAADTDTAPKGEFRFDLPDWSRPTAAKSTRASKAIREAQATEAALATYQRLLMKSCDIIDLANMPEDQHLAARTLDLRRLYVPLRARVEAPGADADEPWTRMEERRRREWLGDRAPENETADRVAIGERLAVAKRVIVLGDPGGGKTTLTRWITTVLLLRARGDAAWRDIPDGATVPDGDLLPILIRCRDLTGECLNGDFDDITRHTLRRAEMSGEEGDRLVAEIRKRMTTGNALLILDGLDEIADAKGRWLLCERLEAIARRYQDLPILATSRVVGYRDMGKKLGCDFEHLTLASLSKDEKDDFARRWCASVEPPERREAATSGLIHDIHSNDRIERLTGNPMLLTTMALVKRKIGRLPQKRAELYAEAVQVLLNWRSERDGPLDRDEVVPQLSYLAFGMCERGEQRIRRDGAIARLTGMRAEYPNLHAVARRPPNEFLDLVEARTGILVEIGRERHLGELHPVYEFRHLTVQEYLAARALVDRRLPGGTTGRSLAEEVAFLVGRTARRDVMESWREPLRLTTSLCRDEEVDAVLRAILTPRPDEKPRPRRVRAVRAALCLVDEPNVGEDVVRQILRELAATWPSFRVIGPSFGIFSGFYIEQIAETRWREEFANVFLDEYLTRPGETRGAIGTILGRFFLWKLPNEKQALSAWLKDQEVALRDGDDRIAVCAALVVMRMVSRNKLEKLLDVGALVDPLIARLDGPPPVAHAVAWALSRIYEKGRIDVSDLTPIHCHRVATALDDIDCDTEVVFWLARIVRRQGIVEALEPLLRWGDHPSSHVRSSVIAALGEFDDDRASRMATAKLVDEDEDVRRAAVSGFARSLDAIDRELLLEHEYSDDYFIDPKKPITNARARAVAKRLDLSVPEVLARYRTLSLRFSLTVENSP